MLMLYLHMLGGAILAGQVAMAYVHATNKNWPQVALCVVWILAVTALMTV